MYKIDWYRVTYSKVQLQLIPYSIFEYSQFKKNKLAKLSTIYNRFTWSKDTLWPKVSSKTRHRAIIWRYTECILSDLLSTTWKIAERQNIDSFGVHWPWYLGNFYLKKQTFKNGIFIISANHTYFWVYGVWIPSGLLKHYCAWTANCPWNVKRWI